MNKMKRIHVFFSGKVQGVGFRNTTERLARELGLSGWVKNQPDGRVEMLAEGMDEPISKLIELLDKKFQIDSKEILELELSREESEPNNPEFSILY